MAIARKIMRQRNTFYVSLPPDVLKAFGSRAGDMVVIEQPFSRCVIITPMDQGVLAPDTDQVRGLGWRTKTGGADWLRTKWGITDPSGDIPCRGCGFHKATSRIRELHVCEFCILEITSGMMFRQRPSAPELELMRDGMHSGIDGR